MDNKEKQLQRLVRHEAKALRRNATTEEKERLDFDTLNPKKGDYCVYGQLCHNCFRPRAVELMRKCASRVYNYESFTNLENTGRVDEANGPAENKDRDTFWSPIEVFIVQKNNEKNNKKLIQYIKGETNELNFE